MRRVEEILEGAGLVVQPIDTDNDIGRDAWVELTEGAAVSGSVIAIQVKSGPSYFHLGRWGIPGSEEDFSLWRETSVPMFGISHNPADGSLRWANLSHAAARNGAGEEGALDELIVDAKFGKRAVVTPDENRLDVDPLRFVSAAMKAVRHSRGLPAAQLLSNDPSTVEIGIFDSFALGRQTPEAFLLLAALLTRMPDENRALAIRTIAMATHHPDIFWTESNWIPSAITVEVERALHWTNDDVSMLLGFVVEDENGMGRGSFGQNVYHVLRLDSMLDARLHWLFDDRRTDREKRVWAAAILLYLSDSPLDQLDELLDRAPEMASDEFFREVVRNVREFGFIDLF